LFAAAIAGWTATGMFFDIRIWMDFRKTQQESVMRTRKMFPIPLILAILALLLAGCGASSSPAETPPTPLNGVDIYDIDVNVHTMPQVNLQQAFTVSASISSLYPFSELYGAPTNASRSAHASALAELLRPTAYTGKYALCMIVSLQLDDPSAFAIDEGVTPEFQEFTLVPGVTNSQVVNWTVTPVDTFGAASAQHELSVDIAFDSQMSCQIASPSLLRQYGSPLTYHLVSSSHNTIIFAQTTVVDQDLATQAEFVNGLRNVVGLTIPTLLASILLGMMGWMTGFFLQMRKRLVGYARSTRNQTNADPFHPRRMQPKPGAIISTSMVLLIFGVVAMGGGLLLIFFGPSTTFSFFTSIAVALIGMALIVSGVWLIMPRREAVLALTPVDSSQKRR
jgi:hypothetical protein